MKQHVSPKELGRAVGVSESSLKRWADDGLLRAVRTAGGHRRIAIGDAVTFIRNQGMTVIEPDAIGLPELARDTAEPTVSTRDGAPHQALAAALIDGAAARSRGLILGAYLAGDSVARIGDQLIAPALHQIGELWRHDARGIFIEHRATAICLDALGQLRALFPPAEPDAPLAIGGAPGGDVYIVPSLMAATALAAEGWGEMNLGADTPLDTLRLAATTANPALVWLSISSPLNDKDAPQIEQLATDLGERGIPLIVGGRCVPDRLRHPNLHTARSMSELAAFAAGIKARQPSMS